MKTFLFAVFAFLFSLTLRADFAWANVSPENRLGGRMVSPGYLRGKVVLLDQRDYGNESSENLAAIRQLQTLWATYKTKPFIILGGHCGPTNSLDAVREKIAKIGVTYPIYACANLTQTNATEASAEIAKTEIAKNFAEKKFAMRLVDATCSKILYTGSDVRAATGVAGAAIVNTTSPITPIQFRALIDYELAVLPGAAYRRLAEYRKQFPKESAAYDESWKTLSKDKDILQLVALEEFSQSVKNRDESDKKMRRLSPMKLESMMRKHERLKQHENPFIAQEAKNALADIKWAAATLKKKRRR